MSRAPSLHEVVQAHAKDLRGCAPTLRAYGLVPTSKEVIKAADELERALARAEQSEPTRRELDLAMMIRMLCSHTANDRTRARAMELLRKLGLQGSPLR